MPVCESVRFRIIESTCHASAGTESAHAHTLGGSIVPLFYLVLPLESTKVYESKAADAINIYLKSDTNSAAFRAIVFTNDTTVWD